MTSDHRISRAEIEAGIARARRLRSQYFADLSQALTKALIRRYRGREATRALTDLPEYLLRDIGIAGHEIPAIAAGTLKRRPSALARAVDKGLAAIAFARPAVAPATGRQRKLAA